MSSPPHNHGRGSSSPRWRASGLDEIRALIQGVAAAGLAVVLSGVARSWFELGPWVAIALGAVALAAGERYRLTISAEGIELEKLHAWIVPGARRRYPLDADIKLYQSLEADTPEGLCVSPRWDSGIPESDCFGPYFGTGPKNALLARAQTALIEARRAAGAEVGPLRFSSCPQLDDALESGAREHWRPSGRLKTARLRHAVDVGGVRLPEGTVVECNGEGYLDPRSSDRLRQATLAAPATLPVHLVPAGAPLEATAGAVVTFDAEGRPDGVKGASSGPLTWGRFVLDGTASLAWNERGQIRLFTLAAPGAVGPITLPTGSRFISLLADWTVYPGAPCALPEFAPQQVRSLVVSAALDRVLAVSVEADVEVGGQVILGDRMPIPLRPDLCVDLEACRKSQLLKRG